MFRHRFKHRSISRLKKKEKQIRTKIAHLVYYWWIREAPIPIRTSNWLKEDSWEDDTIRDAWEMRDKRRLGKFRGNNVDSRLTRSRSSLQPMHANPFRFSANKRIKRIKVDHRNLLNFGTIMINTRVR